MPSVRAIFWILMPSARSDRISASTVGPTDILSTGGATIARGVGLHASTHRLTGGRSGALSAPKAFLIKAANGGKVVLIRTGVGKKAVKGIFAETPKAALGQDSAFARKHWEKDAAIYVEREITKGLQAVLNGGSPPTDSGSND